MKTYQILREQEIYFLVQKVNHALKDGWECQGGFFMDSRGWCHQAMTLSLKSEVNDTSKGE